MPNSRFDGSVILEKLRHNAVMIMFVLLSVAGVMLSGLQPTYILMELMSRFTRNAFLILALILPIVAGMGINFAITIGAMAAQIAILLVLNWRIPGTLGIFVAALLTVPLASFFGFLIGQLLNKMKGQEMIGSMILGYFANGLYQLLFLFIFGQLIPIANSDLTIMGATGISNTLDLSVSYGIKYGLDNLWKLPFGQALYVFSAAAAALLLALYFLKKRSLAKTLVPLTLLAIACLTFWLPSLGARLGIANTALVQAAATFVKQFSFVRVPMATILAIALLGVFNVLIMKTRLGQQFRAVGQSQSVANAAGIHVNRTRMIAIMLSTVFAGWGQIIYLQNLGALQTYAAHEQVGLYAGAAILVGGASIMRATNGQALLGCILFHTLFIVAPKAGVNLFGDPAIGEYFRVFVSYGVIALALVMHAWKNLTRKKPGAELAR